MNILAFDTSGPVLSVALQCGENPIREKTHFGAWEHMENLLPFIDELLTQEKITIHQATHFIINRGPGSFTGLRIGFATLKGLVITHPTPSYSCDSLTALAERVPAESTKHLAVCLDAFRGQFYFKLFENQKGTWISNDAPRACEIHQLIQKLPEKTLITGDALKRFRSVFQDAPQKHFSIADENFWYPRASSLIRLYKNQPRLLKKLVSSDDFLPSYLRLSEPEERKAELKQ